MLAHRLGVCAAATALLLVLAGPRDLWAQVGSSPFRAFEYTHYKPNLAEVHPQNWCVTQSMEGVIYVCNGAGILEFDGATWRLHRTTTHSVVRSMAIGRGGEIYAGANGDIGRLSVNKSGELQWESLITLLPDSAQVFKDVWQTLAWGERIVFVSRSQIFVWDGETFRVLASSTGFHTAFSVDGRIIVREFGVGLLELTEAGVRLLPGGDFYADKKVYLAVSVGSGRWLIGTREHGFFAYDGTASKRFVTSADAEIAEGRLYHGVSLGDSLIGVGTLDRGFFVLDRRGRLIEHLSLKRHLPDNVVNALFQDREGGTWLALNNEGLVRFRLETGLTVLGSGSGLSGAIYDVALNSDTSFVATGAGLFGLTTRTQGGSPATIRIEDSDMLPWAVEVMRDGEVLVAGEGGVLALESGQFLPVGDSYQLVPVGSDSVVVASENGLDLLYKGGGRWLASTVLSHPQPVKDLVRDRHGVFWFSDQAGDVFRVLQEAHTFTAATSSKVEFAGTQPKGRVLFGQTQLSTVVVTAGGIYRLAHDEFPILKPDLEMETDVANPILDVSEDAGGRLWLLRKHDAFVRVGDTTWVEIPSLRFPRETIGSIYFDDDIAWISSGNTLYRFDPKLDKRIVPTFPPIVRRVSSIGSDSTIYYGYAREGAPTPKLDYGDNDVHFAFSAPIYHGHEHTAYSYLLEGRDQDWSDWTTDTIAEYTNLREGSYSFRIRARNIYGNESPEGAFTFSILPPWYRTWWAYLMYVAGCAVVAALGVRYYRMTVAHRRAVEQEKELQAERVFNERLRYANEKLKTANNRLVEVNNLKDEFLATTSHELRTPITAIQGYANILKEELSEPHREFAEIIDSSSQRLMRTLNSVLDLAKLRSGTIDVNLAVIQLSSILTQIVEPLLDAAAEKGLNLTTDCDRSIHVMADQYLLKNILTNIIDNAIKFSDAGSITVSASPQNEMAIITIADQGIGIDDEFMPQIFDEFKQESGGLSREHGGTGLGLAITALMVEAVGGAISVESEKGVGTRVRVEIPIATAYDSPKTGPSGDRNADRQPTRRPDSAQPGIPDKPVP